MVLLDELELLLIDLVPSKVSIIAVVIDVGSFLVNQFGLAFFHEESEDWE